ncbi:unnamed protein product [Absidia cylindrospora]
MNKMKRTASKTVGQDSNDNGNDPTKISSPTEILSISTTTTTTKGNMDIQSLGNKSLNDATSIVSISGITGSYFGMSSVNGYDIDSSLRVHHYGASSERSSFLSDDIQSNASIKSKPWASQLISSNHNNNNNNYDGEASTLSITNGAAHHSIRTFNSTEPSPISQHVSYYGKEMDDDSDDYDDDDDFDDDRVDGDIFRTSYHPSDSVLPTDLQQTSTNNSNNNNNNNNNNTESKQYQPQRRWSENGYPPHTLGRIKAGLGRLIGRDQPSSTGDHRGSLS